jgi:hypothetical protein
MLRERKKMQNSLYFVPILLLFLIFVSSTSASLLNDDENRDVCSTFHNNTEYFTISEWEYNGEKFILERPSNVPKHFEINVNSKNQVINTAIESLLISNKSVSVEYQGNLSEITANIGENVDLFMQNVTSYVNTSKNDGIKIIFCGKDKIETEILAETIISGMSHKEIEDLFVLSAPAKIRMAIPMFIFVQKN